MTSKMGFIKTAVLFCYFGLTITSLEAKSRKPIALGEEAKRLHFSSLVWDAHNDLALQLYLRQDQKIKRFDISKQQEKLQTDIPRLKEGGIKAQFWSANPADFPNLHFPRPFHNTNVLIDIIDSFSTLYPSDFEFARSATDVKRIYKTGKIASLIGIEGGNAIEGKIENLKSFYNRGARYMTLTHFANNEIADAGTDKEKYGGLSDFGRKESKKKAGPYFYGM